jgi:Arabinose efflux permease
VPLIDENTIKTIMLEAREIERDINIKGIKIKSWKRKEVLKDYRFYVVSLNMLARPGIATGIFVYQSFIAESKRWSIYTIPKGFMGYSISSIVTWFISGLLVDKFTSRKLIQLINLLLLIAMLVLFLSQHEISAYIFLGLIGISNGLANVLGSSTWAEIYGVKFIGSIKGLTTAFMVFSIAFGTALFGILIDKGLSIEDIGLISGIYILISLTLLITIRKNIEPIKLTK